VDATGKGLLVGGWGYLLGDEGGGYWIGLQALKALAKVYDGALEMQQGQMLAKYVSEMLELRYPKDLLKWLYKGEPPTRDVARLAEVVFHAFEEGDQLADGIIQHATWALGDLVKLVSGRLMLEKPDVAFAGSLLTEDTPLRTRLAKHLGLASAPLPLYPPVVGAALLAIQAAGAGLPPAQSTGDGHAD
jgi:N-acetylglucosamine kinase-like BadF-type ATPase